MPAALSEGFQTLLREPAFCQIATLMADGSPQITQTWVDTDGEHILVNTSESRQKTRNVRRDPRVAVNVVDPNNQWRLAAVRGKVVEVTTEGAEAHIDKLNMKYRGEPVYPWKNPADPRVILKISPDRINETGLD